MKLTDGIIKIKADENGVGEIIISSDTVVKNIVLTIKSRLRDERFIFNYDNIGKKLFSGEFRLKRVLVWSVQTPNLYDFSVEIQCADKLKEANGSFGCRSISQDG